MQVCKHGGLWNLTAELGQGLLGSLISYCHSSQLPSLIDHDKEGRLGGSPCRNHTEGSK